MYYINSKSTMIGCSSVTTEFEFSTKKEAEKKLDEILTIKMSDEMFTSEFSYFSDYYISRRCTKDWSWKRKIK